MEEFRIPDVNIMNINYSKSHNECPREPHATRVMSTTALCGSCLDLLLANSFFQYQLADSIDQ
ncbi:hypothetical protein C0J52_16032 [Blattella germanica]|nr:hypothetical protein C0J52_16032 [Blattella germanica]